MALIAGTIQYLATVTLTAASGGDATTIAAMFNGNVIAGINLSGPATAAANGSVVTITWPAAAVRVGPDIILNAVAAIIATNLTLTTPITGLTVTLQGKVI